MTADSSSQQFLRDLDKKLWSVADRSIDFTAQRGNTSYQSEAIPQSVSAAKDHFGKEPANSFTSDQRSDTGKRSHLAGRLRSKGQLMANPPFNISEWWDAKLEGGPRWRYGTPPRGNANFAWIQHMLHHLAPQGAMALLLANGSMSSGSGGEGQIRQALIEADLVECMVALPGQLFTNTQIPAELEKSA